jgi:hypothetical protein
MSEISNQQIYELLIKMSSDMASMKDEMNSRLGRMEEKLDLTHEQVGTLTVQMTESKKIKEIFSEKVLKAVEAI